MARVQHTIDVVDRWLDSDDCVAWPPPSPEEEVEIRAGMASDVNYMRPEIAENERKFRARNSRTNTTAQQDCIMPSAIEQTAIDVASAAIAERGRDRRGGRDGGRGGGGGGGARGVGLVQR